MEKLKTLVIAKAAEKVNEYLENRTEVIVYDTTTTDDDVTLTAEDSGKTIVLDKADGVNVTLPLAEVGLKFKFVVNTTVTSNGYNIKTQNTSDLFVGSVSMVDTDTSDTHTQYDADVSDDDSIEMNGSTTGGLIGSWLKVECIAAGKWFVQGTIRHTGDVATPFDESFTTTAAPTTT